MTMLARIQAYLNEASKIKPEWHQFVTGRSAPLAERWTTYWTAPKEWRGEINSSSFPAPCLELLFDSPYDDFNMDRGVTKSLKRIMEQVEDKLAYNDVKGLTQELIDQAKEEIMAKKLGEWKNDW